MRNWMLWTAALLLTLVSAVYQRVTGPTYEVRVDAEFAGGGVRGELLRSHDVGSDLPVGLEVDTPAVTGRILWRRLGAGDGWITAPMAREGDRLVAHLPAQPAAGKLEYSVVLARDDETLVVSGERAVVARFKGDVPRLVLAPHILFMFLAMLWSTRTGLEAVVDGPRRGRMSLTTLGLLVVGGLILGPIVQKYAFGAYWTGWPLGEDLTDNKLAAAVLAWVWASWRRGDGRWPRAVAIVAALVVLGVFLIPHSLHGSTLDNTTSAMVSG
ncbi:hypothetical protein KKG45_06065 [bacterium]|nr:hypothetical protein [bacterium]MBU1072792.1 hypothetical protein [bacterium]